MSNDSGERWVKELDLVRGALAAWRATPGKGQSIPALTVLYPANGEKILW